MESIGQPLISWSLTLLVVLVSLQIIPPLIRVYLRRTGAKRLKLFLFGVAFVALYFRVFAKRKIRTDEGIILSGNLRTNTLLKCIYLTGCYEPSLAAHLKRNLKPGDVFLDIGANSGHFTMIAANLGADVISVEASPANCRLFTANIAANDLGSRVRLIHAAAGNKNGHIEFLENMFNGMCSTTSQLAFWYLRPLTRKISIPEVRIDDELDSDALAKVRFVKIDVEGAELTVLRGLSNLIRAGRGDLEFCLEFSPSWLTPEQAQEIFSTFSSNGYRAFKLVNKEMDFPPYNIRVPEPCSELPTKQVDMVFSRMAPVSGSVAVPQ